MLNEINELVRSRDRHIAPALAREVLVTADFLERSSVSLVVWQYSNSKQAALILEQGRWPKSAWALVRLIPTAEHVGC